MKKWLIGVIFVTLVSTKSFGDPKDTLVSYETLLKQFDGGPKKAGEVVIQSKKEWEQFIKECSSESTRDKLQKQKIDFDKETVVVVAIGHNSSKLTPNEQAQAGIQRILSGEKPIVEYCNVRTDVQVEEDRYPLHVVKIAKTKTITFRKSEKDIGG
jgi:hypothetical protein